MNFGVNERFTTEPMAYRTRDGTFNVLHTEWQDRTEAKFKRVAKRLEAQSEMLRKRIAENRPLMGLIPETQQRTVRPIAFQLSDEDRERLTALRETNNELLPTWREANDTDND